MPKKTKRSTKKKQPALVKLWLNFEYRHTTIAVSVLLLTILFINTALAAVVLEWFQRLGYVGAFIGGLMLVWTFASAPAVVLLLSVSESVSLPIAILVAASGSVLGDWIILKYFNDEIGRELKPFFTKTGIRGLVHKLRKSKIRWAVALIGAFIVMLPLPDEFGITLMGLSRAKRWKILTACFFLDAAGVAMVLSAGRII
jgi:hypothetical protein